MFVPEPIPKSGFIVAAVVAIAFNAAFVSGAQLASKKKPMTAPITVSLQDAPPPPEVEPLPEPEPEPPKKVVDLTRPQDTPPPPSNVSNAEPPPPDAPPPKQVFGLSKESLAEGASNSGLAMRVGNTLMKREESEFTDPNSVKSYSGPPRPVPISKVTELPRPRAVQKPIYPPEMRSDGREATVVLEIEIGEDGSVRNARVVRSGGPAFDQAALAAIRQSKYYPAKAGEAPVPVKIKVPIRFVLTD